MYDERAQEEVWGEDPEALIASGIAYPQGQARRVDGGFAISGRWNFSSCVNVADWNMLAVTVREGERVDRPPHVPAAQVRSTRWWTTGRCSACARPAA